MLASAALERDHQGNPLPRARLVFLVVGPARGGGGALQSALDRHPQLTCVGGLWDQESKLRRDVHEHFYGPLPAVEDGEVESLSILNPERYLDAYLFAVTTNAHGFGMRLTYEELARCDLWDYLEARGREDGFCILHLTRNPLAIFLSQERQRQSGVVCRFRDEPEPAIPFTLECSWNAREVSQFVRQQEAYRARVERISGDQLILRYHEFRNRYRDAWRQVCNFLEIEQFLAEPELLPLTGVRPMEKSLLSALPLPPDVRQHLEHELV